MAADETGASTIAAPTNADQNAVEQVSKLEQATIPAKTVSGAVTDAASSLGSMLSLTNHPKSSAAAYAYAITPLVLAAAQHFFGWDLSAYKENITEVVMLAAALIAPNA